jgi:two-component system sensor histidine kinase KdpD
VADTLRLAQALGGEAITLPGGDRNIADDVIGYAHAHNVTQIIIGKSTRSRWFEILHGSVVHDLVRRSGDISVHVIAGEQLTGNVIPQKSTAGSELSQSYDPRPYVLAMAAVAIALGCGELIDTWIGLENVDLVFLSAIVGVAARFGLWPSLLASVAAALCYNFFFLPPIYTLTIEDPHNIVPQDQLEHIFDKFYRARLLA